MTPGNILGTDVKWASLRKWHFRKRTTSKEVQHPVHFFKIFEIFMQNIKHKLRTKSSNRFKTLFKKMQTKGYQPVDFM